MSIGIRATMNTWLCAHRFASMPAGGGGSMKGGIGGTGLEFVD